jgi:hypothetical protein
MIKIPFYCILALTVLHVEAGLDECFRDAKTHGHHLHSMSPQAGCAELILSDQRRVEFKTPSGIYHAYGQGPMFYLDSFNKEEKKSVLQAGDQSELTTIVSLHINETKKKVIVLQEEEAGRGILTFDLNFLGNVSPQRYYRSLTFADIEKVKLVSSRNEIGLLSTVQKQFAFLNEDADIRFQGEKFLPVITKIISGEKTLMEHPRDFAYHELSGELFVLDQDRILIFSRGSHGNATPIRVIQNDSIRGIYKIEFDASRSEIVFYYPSDRVVVGTIDLAKPKI